MGDISIYTDIVWVNLVLSESMQEVLIPGDL